MYLSFIHDELKKGAKAMQVILCQTARTQIAFSAKVDA